MSGFDIAWLDLRAPADRTARNARLLRRAAARLAQVEQPLIVDLGSGTGASVRALAPLLAHPARWRLVDKDPLLLAEAARRCPGVETLAFDLGQGLPPIGGAQLITASALIDLVSAAWLQALATAVTRTGAALWASLSYDGRLSWTPAHSLDEAVHAAFDSHQQRDKGFGSALGPGGVDQLEERLVQTGYQVTTADSAWRLGIGDTALTLALIDGIAAAVQETCRITDADLAAWRRFRRAAAATGTALVGHRDLLAYSATMV